jgi:hypothetical protein
VSRADSWNIKIEDELMHEIVQISKLIVPVLLLFSLLSRRDYVIMLPTFCSFIGAVLDFGTS